MQTREQSILTVNAGSSSVRLAAFSLERPLNQLASQHLAPPPAEPARAMRAFLIERDLPKACAVAHRVVHGGRRLVEPCVVDEAAEAEIERMGQFAPLHNPVALAWIRSARQACGEDVPQVAAFDTGFYHQLPEVAARYALPNELAEQHEIRRYGFHGLAHLSMLAQWHASGHSSPARVISLQLGAGCSITASRDGRPVETSMGFSPLEGLMMATRSGDLDPAAVLHLLEHGGLQTEEIGRLLNRESGLKGVSGLSGDMEELLACDAPRAALAVAMFCHRARKYLGAYLALLGGADAILFGGGIGEHAPSIRARILADLEWADIHLDEVRNESGAGAIHAEGGRCEIHVIEVDEARLLAGYARDLVHDPQREGGSR